jgi:hypothetical protein
MGKRLIVIALALLLASPFLLPYLPGVRRFVRAGPETCEGRFEGRWRLLASEREKYADLSDGAYALELKIEDSYEPSAGNACPSLWGSVTVDGATRNFHSNFFDLIFNDGDSFVTDPSGRNNPLSVMVWKQQYAVLPRLLQVIEPLGEGGDHLEVSGYMGGRQGTLMYERVK